MLKKLIGIFLIVAAISGCNLLFSRAPVLSVLISGLGEYEVRPTWHWDIAGPDLIQGFRYSLDVEGQWTEVGPEVFSYRPVQPLTTGSHTLYLQASSAVGLWSRTVSESVEVVEPGAYTPNDPYFIADAGDYPGQWSFVNIRIQQLWQFILDQESTGLVRDEIVVAVVDTGYTDHPELLANQLDTQGYDFISDAPYSGDGDGIDADAQDEGDDDGSGWGNSWHGTTVSSIIGAQTNNQDGMSGIGLTKIKLLPVRALGVGGGTTYDISQAILYAAGMTNDSGTVPTSPAKVINLSLGADGMSDPYMDPVLGQVTAAGIIVVAAGGNERQYGYQEVSYPANSAFTIAVAASSYDGTIAPYSNPGQLVDIAAPGGSGMTQSWYDWVFTAAADEFAGQPLSAGDYEYWRITGTSIATPHVAGLLGLLCTIDGDIDLSLARWMLTFSAVDLGTPGWDRDFGHGLIDAYSTYGAYLLSVDYPNLVGETEMNAPASLPMPAMDKVGINPAGSAHTGTLIVRFKSDFAASTASPASMGGIKGVRGRVSRDRIAELDGSRTLVEAREALLMDPDVEAVYYNYIYEKK